ncbi:hypothetical protein F5Y18DRAFT_438105 [Xylariaceae sp. FL1019]|nr:hypothetical protein F5Y18DRAFT_438105 [Xylariaceae sp. FL1019]
MQWISRNKAFLPSEIRLFNFDATRKCSIQTLKLWQDSSGQLQPIEDKTHTSEQEYLQWVSKLETPDREPTVILVLHDRIVSSNAKATWLPYGEETFKTACRSLFQHRSAANVIARHSTAIFTSRIVPAWKSRPQWGPAVVYNCKSDTKSPNYIGQNDIILSVTHFPQVSKIFAVFYGCTSTATSDLVNGFLFSKAFMSDPLLLPMTFFEFERKRLMDTLDLKRGELRQRILDMNNRLKEEGVRSSLSSRSSDSEQGGSDIITRRECDAVNLWVDVSTLKNGLQSFNKQLELMSEASKKPLERSPIFIEQTHEQDELLQHSSSSIQARLHDITVEIDSNIKIAESLLGGMSQAAQAESNFLSRQDTRATISIAIDTKVDSSHMRSIAFFGMIFLPGTFFATLFSMTFFNWIPQDSNQIVSPWIAMYFGLTFLATGTIVWQFQSWAKSQKKSVVEKIFEPSIPRVGRASPWGRTQEQTHGIAPKQDTERIEMIDVEAGHLRQVGT